MYQDPSIGAIKLTYVVTNVTIIEPAKVCIYGLNNSFNWLHINLSYFLNNSSSF